MRRRIHGRTPPVAEDHRPLATREPSIHGSRPLANGQKRPEVARARNAWIIRRQPFMRNMLMRIGFIDETSLKTNMAKTTGWSPCGARLLDHVPFGHWNTQTFIAALRQDRLDAPWVIGGPINRIRHAA